MRQELSKRKRKQKKKVQQQQEGAQKQSAKDFEAEAKRHAQKKRPSYSGYKPVASKTIDFGNKYLPPGFKNG